MISKTRQAILEIRTKNPNKPAGEIAQELGISRERVRQHLIKLGLPTMVLYKPQVIKHCQECGNNLSRATAGNLCNTCLNRHKHEESLVMVICTQCGKETHKGGSRYRRGIKLGYKHWFCDKKCQGRWVGLNYGGEHGL